LGIGIVAGLRTMTAPAVVAWATHLAWLDLWDRTLLHGIEVGSDSVHDRSAGRVLSVDQLPKTPARTTAGPLAARIVMGALNWSVPGPVRQSAFNGGAVLA